MVMEKAKDIPEPLADLIDLAKMIIGTENATSASDINGDGEVNASDFTELKKIFLA